jgi:hypothetical protein
VGLAVLGAILVNRDEVNVAGALTRHGVPQGAADQVAGGFSSGAPGARPAGSQAHAIVHDVQLAFAHSTQTVFYVMAAVMAATFLVAVRYLPRGRVEATPEEAVPAVAG